MQVGIALRQRPERCGQPMRIIACVLETVADWPEMDQTAGQADGWE